MKHLNLRSFLMALLIMIVGIFMLGRCDSGEKVVDKGTGNQAVKQYHNMKVDVRKHESTTPTQGLRF